MQYLTPDPLIGNKVAASMQQILRLINVNVFAKRNLIARLKSEPPPQSPGFVQEM